MGNESKRVEDTPIIQATVGDLAKAIVHAVGIGIRHDESCVSDDPKKNVNKHYVYGLKGLAELLGCSYPTASRLKSAGMFDGAISQVNNIIVADADMILDLYKSKKKIQRKK